MLLVWALALALLPVSPIIFVVSRLDARKQRRRLAACQRIDSIRRDGDTFVLVTGSVERSSAAREVRLETWGDALHEGHFIQGLTLDGQALCIDGRAQLVAELVESLRPQASRTIARHSNPEQPWGMQAGTAAIGVALDVYLVSRYLL